MTKQDLDLLYKQETENDVPSLPIAGEEVSVEEIEDMDTYVNWLEDKYLTLYNITS